MSVRLVFFAEDSVRSCSDDWLNHFIEDFETRGAEEMKLETRLINRNKISFSSSVNVMLVLNVLIER